MEIKILDEIKQPLLSRTSYKLRIFGSKTTPSNAKTVEILADKFKADAGLVTIQGIYQGFGAHTTTILARIYDSKENLLKVEPKKKAPKEEEK